MKGPTVKVGDTVVLNDEGLETAFGRTFGLGHMKTLEMKITSVDQESLTEPEETYAVEVDHPDLSMLLLHDTCFTVVRHK